MNATLTIVTRSQVFFNTLKVYFHNENWSLVRIHSKDLTSDLLKELNTDLIIIDIDQHSLNNTLAIFEKIQLDSLRYGIFCILQCKNIPLFHFLTDSHKIYFLGKPLRKEEFIVNTKKYLQIIEDRSREKENQKKLEWEIKKSTSDLTTTFQIAEYQSQRLDIIINSIPAGFFAIDTLDDIVMMNRNAEEILKMRFSECIGKSLWKEVNATVAQHFQKIMSNLHTDGSDDHLLIKDEKGIDNYYKIVIRDFFDHESNPLGKIFILINETSRIEVNLLRNSFFTIVSHELRTPLTIIKNGVMLLKIEKSRAAQGQIISDMSEATERSTDLVNNIIHMAHINEVNVHAFYRKLSVTDFMTSLINQFQQKALKKSVGITLENRIPNIKYIETDPGLINMVLGNILDNAIKYNKVGGKVPIIIYMENEYICFSINDEGEGIKEEASKCFFRSFIQGESCLTRSHGGIGVGLYIARRAADLIQGKISFSSDKTVGSTFTLKILQNPKKTICTITGEAS